MSQRGKELARLHERVGDLLSHEELSIKAALIEQLRPAFARAAHPDSKLYSATFTCASWLDDEHRMAAALRFTRDIASRPNAGALLLLDTHKDGTLHWHGLVWTSLDHSALVDLMVSHGSGVRRAQTIPLVTGQRRGWLSKQFRSDLDYVVAYGLKALRIGFLPAEHRSFVSGFFVEPLRIALQKTGLTLSEAVPPHIDEEDRYHLGARRLTDLITVGHARAHDDELG